MQRRRLYARRHICVGVCEWGVMTDGKSERRKQVWAETEPARWQVHHWTVSVLDIVLDGVKVLRVKQLVTTTTSISEVWQCNHWLRRQSITVTTISLLHWRRTIAVSRYSVITSITPHLHHTHSSHQCTEASWDSHHTHSQSCYLLLSTCLLNLKSLSAHYKDMKRDTKFGIWGGLGSLTVTENSAIW